MPLDKVQFVAQKITINPYVECDDCGWTGLIEETNLYDFKTNDGKKVLFTRMSCPECESTQINSEK